MKIVVQKKSMKVVYDFTKYDLQFCNVCKRDRGMQKTEGVWNLDME